MDSFIRIREMLKHVQANGAESTNLRQIEDEVLFMYRKFDNEVKSLTKDLLTKTDDLQSKTNRCEVLINEQFDLYKELVSTKESVGSLIKYLNISLKSSSMVVARTIVEMTCKSELQRIVTNAELVANSFRRSSNYAASRNLIDILMNARRSKAFEKLNTDDREDIEIYSNWFAQSHRNNSLPTREILRKMWRRAKPAMIITVLSHPKFGSVCDEWHSVKFAFANLYQTLSENVHNSSLTYEEEVLPIPDMNGNKFTKADALALATFYSIALPNMPFAVTTNVLNLPLSAVQWIDNLQNTAQVSETINDTTTNEAKVALSKRKNEDTEENDAAFERC